MTLIPARAHPPNDDRSCGPMTPSHFPGVSRRVVVCHFMPLTSGF